ncbi:PIG-L deacetylase family protein [Chloroflexota bacterium]
MDKAPGRVMVVTPHPDDAEFGCAGTIAQWIREGSEVIYVVCTNGDKGSGDPDMTSERLTDIRRKEQLAAAEVLGVKEVIFLDHPDGGLEDTPLFRGQIVREIRRFRPDLVFCADPHRRYHWHRDHRISATATLDAIFPYARDHLFYPEHKAEGLTPHKVKEACTWGAENPDTFFDISDTFETKLAALSCHKSQVGYLPPEELEGFLRQMASRFKEVHGLPLAESFYRIEFRR